MTQIRIKVEGPRRKSWRQKLLRAVLVLILLLVALYFVLTSAFFVKQVVLPLASNALKADITVGDLQLSPFRRVVLRDVKVQPRGNEPLLTVKEVRAGYSLLAILRGNLKVSEVFIESPEITIVEGADGRSNLDLFLKNDSAEKARTTSGAVPQVDVKLVALNRATVRFTKHHAGGASDVSEVSGVNFKLQDLKNGQVGKMEMSLNLAVTKAARATVAASAIQAKLGAQFVFDLAADLKPAAVKGSLNFTVENAAGELADLSALAARLDCDVTGSEIKQLALRFTKADVALGEVRVSGPLDLAKLEGKLKLEVLSLDRRVLNLAGAASGLDFGTTTINASTDIELLRAGQAISVAGRLEAARLQLLQRGRVSPTLDLRCDYAVAVDGTAKTAELRFLNLTGAQNSRAFLQSELPQSLTIAWGETAAAGNDATFGLSIADFNLAEWREFLGDDSLAGKVSAKLQLAASQGGKKLRAELAGGVDKLSATAGSNRVEQVDFKVASHASITGLKAFKLEDFRFEILHEGQSALVATAAGAGQAGGRETELQMSVQATLARLGAAMKLPGLDISAGTLSLRAHVQQKDASRSVVGKLGLMDFSARQGEMQLSRLGTDVDFELVASDQAVEIQKLTGLLRVADQPAGRIDAGGKIELAAGSPSGRLVLKASDLNQELLRPFVATALGDKQLVSVVIGASVTVDLEAKSRFKLIADAAVTNLVVSDPKHPALATPLQMRMLLDTSMAKQVAQFNQCRLTLTPTDRAKNELNLTGRMDLSRPDAIKGHLKLSADALDFTRYYDLFATKPAPATAAPRPAAKPTPSSAPAALPEPESEPKAMELPLQDFTCDVSIGHLYLHEVDISNWHAIATVASNQITLQPCQFAVNGGPVEIGVAADLGVPGYRYAVGFSAQRVPLTPLVNTFATDRAGQIGGHLIANLDLKGAGVTGASLQTNLTGQFNVLATNLNLSINNVRTPILNAIVNTIIGLPDLIAGLTGKRDAGQMKWADEITAKPIDVLLVNGVAGNGKIEVKEADVNSAAFRVQTGGEIQLATVLTNSTLQFPVHVALGRPYAAKLGMVNANTPTNTAYVALPDFLAVKGTLGKVETDVSKTGLLKVAGKTMGGLGKETGGALGEAGKSIYGATSGFLKDKFGNSNTNAPTATDTNNAAETKRKSSIFNLFKREKKE